MKTVIYYIPKKSLFSNTDRDCFYNKVKHMLNLVFILLMSDFYAQNLVPNPSFENYTACPNSSGQLSLAQPWFTSTTGTPDYYNICQNTYWGVPGCCGNYQFPKSGNAYAGFYTGGPNLSPSNAREYVQIQLTDSMLLNHKYGISFFVSLHNLSNYAISNIGCYISKDIPSRSDTYPIDSIPQIENPVGNYLSDTLNWMEIRGTYVAIGGEKIITIGNFRDDAHTDTTNAFIPGNGGAYYYYIDDVSVIDSTALGIKELKNKIELTAYPNPANNTITLSSALPLANCTLQLYDVLGNVVWQQNYNNASSFNVNTTTIPDGIYFIKLFSAEGLLQSKKVIIQH